MARKQRSPIRVDLEAYVSAAELAHSVGVSTETVAWYAKRRAKHWRMALRHVQGRNYVHLSVAEAYLNRLGLERRAKKPTGWKTLKAVLAESGAGRSTAMKAVRGGELRAVLVGASIYLHPEDADAFTLRHQNLKPLAGWVMVSALKSELGRSKEAVNQWLRRHRDEVDVRHYLHPSCNRPGPYIKEADAERYRAIVAGGSEKHTGRSFSERETNRSRVQEGLKAQKIH